MRTLCLAVGSAVLAFASPALAGDACCRGGPTVVYAEPPVTIVVPPTGYVLDPSDAHPSYWVDQGAVYPCPRVISFGEPTYSEGGYAFPYDTPYVRHYPYVRSYYGDASFTAPRYRPHYPHAVYRHYGYRPYGYRRFGYRPYSYRAVDRAVIVRARVGYGHFHAPYGAYRYRVPPNARVIYVPDAR